MAPTRPLPDLPFEIIRRILHHRLALPPSFPSAPTCHASSSSSFGVSDDMETAWEGMPGQMGKKIGLIRKKEREDVTRAAMSLLRVCKDWKPIIQKYLYISPPITASSLLPLTHSVHTGDKKWDDTRLHPHSTPGRYIQTLDLSTLSDGYFGPHVTSLSKACAVLLPLLPNLQHLKLPGGTGWGIIPCHTIIESPFIGTLRCLEGVQISDLDQGQGEVEDNDDICGLLRKMRRLEVISILGPGSSIFSSTPDPSSPTSLDLPNLHTITLDGVQRGRLLSTLISSDLPSLRRVLVTSYNETISDLTTSFLTTHGHKLTSITFLPTREWPALHPTPPLNILEICPNLLDLVILIPNTALSKKRDLAKGLTNTTINSHHHHHHHPLISITIPKWLDRVSASPNASPAPTSITTTSHRRDPAPMGNPFLAILLDDPLPNLRRIKVDGFSYVSPKLGRAAQYAGAGGETRVWAMYARRRGVELVDGEGKLVPVVAMDGVGSEDLGAGGGSGERGRRRGSRGIGMVSVAFKTLAVEENEEDGG